MLCLLWARQSLTKAAKSAINWPDVAAFVFYAVVAARAAGSSAVYVIAVAAALGIALLTASRNGSWVSIISVVACIFAAVIHWPIVYLWGFWALVAGVCSHRDLGMRRMRFSAAFLLLWLLQAVPLGSWTAIPPAAFALFIFFAVAFTHLWNRCYLVLAGACVVLTIVGLLACCPQLDIQIARDPQAPPGSAVGPLVSKIIGARTVGPGNVAGDLGVTSLMYDQEQPQASRSICLLEHGVNSPTWDVTLIRGDLQQSEPWSANQLFGDQYLLAAIAADGCWNSNLGTRLRPSGRLVLGSASHRGGGWFEPVVIKIENTLYLNDSDPFVDRLAGYQRSAVTELTIGIFRYRFLNLALAMACLLISLPRFRIISAIAPLGGSLVILLLPCSGDITVVGRVDWPHEPSRASGVARSLADAGQPVLMTRRPTPIVVIDEGRKYEFTGVERLIILCPAARFSCGETQFEADVLPLGLEAGIQDARTLIINGTPRGPVWTSTNMTVIATGSPAKLSWNTWLQSSGLRRVQ